MVWSILHGGWACVCARACFCACVWVFCMKCSVAHVLILIFLVFFPLLSPLIAANMKGRNFFSIQQFGTYPCDCLTSQHRLITLSEHRETCHMKSQFSKTLVISSTVQTRKPINTHHSIYKTVSLGLWWVLEDYFVLSELYHGFSEVKVPYFLNYFAARAYGTSE